jgi:xanthosine phosphorylase
MIACYLKGHMTYSNNPSYCVDIIRAHKPDFTPRVAFILGSGLGALASQIEDAVAISYEKLPGFPVSTVHRTCW